MSYSDLQKLHTSYLSGVKAEAMKLVLLIQSQTNQQIEQMFIVNIGDAFNKAMVAIEKVKSDFEAEHEECKKAYGDNKGFLKRVLDSNKRIAGITINADLWGNMVKKLGKEGGIDISRFTAIIDAAKQKTIDYINSIE